MHLVALNVKVYGPGRELHNAGSVARFVYEPR